MTYPTEPKVKPIKVKRRKPPTLAELNLKAALARSKRVGHVACVAHAVGVWPA